MVLPPIPKRKLNVGVIRMPPYAMQTGNAQWTGIGPEIWREIARKLNIYYDFKEMTLTEALQALHDGKIDFLATPISVVFEREKYYDFTIPIFTTGLAIARPKLPKTHIWWNAIHLFFRWQVLEIVGLLVFILFVLGTIVYFLEHKHNPEYFGKGLIQGIGAGAYWVGAVLTSGVCIGIAIKSLPGRIIALLWMFISVVAISTLTASTASILTNQKLTNTEIRLETYRKLKIGAIKGGVSEEYLQAFNLKVIGYDSPRAGLHGIVDGKISAFVGDDLILNYILKRDNLEADIDLTPAKNYKTEIAFALPLNSPLRKTIYLALLEILSEPSWRDLKEKFIESLNNQQDKAPSRRPHRNSSPGS